MPTEEPLTIFVFTCDRGVRELRTDAPARRVASVLQEVLENGLWTEFARFTPRMVARALPHLQLPAPTRRVAELWLEVRDGEPEA